MSDHVVSAVTSQDCAMHRVVLGKNICSPIEADGVAVAKRDSKQGAPQEEKRTTRQHRSMSVLAENLSDKLHPAAGPVDGAAPFDSAMLAIARPLNRIERKDKATGSAGRNTAKRYLVIGRYEKLADAGNAKKQHSGHGAAVRMVLQDGALLYQVTAGPLKPPDAKNIENEFGKLGVRTRVAIFCVDRETTALCSGARTQLTALHARRGNRSMFRILGPY
jgi:hypothetical protein